MRAIPPRLFNIPPDVPFLKALARAILQGDFPVQGMAPPGPFDLPQWTIYLPTRRAARALTQAFLEQQAKGARLLPRIRSFGDMDEEELAFAEPWPGAGLAELPPAISNLERQFLLARLIHEWAASHPASELAQSLLQAPGTALSMAQSLGRLFDNFEMEELSLEALAQLAGPEYPEHREALLSLLDILRLKLPQQLDGLGLMGQAARRSAMIRAEAERLKAKPPQSPVIAAGSTGSIPATAELLQVISRLPKGCVILPGLDMGLDDKAWQLLERVDQQQHPQWGLSQLLRRLGADREDVQMLPHLERRTSGPHREFLLSELMRPAEATDAWESVLRGRETDLEQGLTGIHFMLPNDSRQEALSIAILMRSVLEKPQRTAALITPDRNLARRVKAELSRWQIELDDTAGEPLARSAQASFMRMLLEAAAQPLNPQALMSLLRHPFTKCAAASSLELILRGHQVPETLSQLGAFIAHHQDQAKQNHHLAIPLQRLETSDWQEAIKQAERISQALAPLSQKAEGQFSLTQWLDAHIEAANTITVDPSPWQDEAGEALTNLLQEFRQAQNSAPALSHADYLGLFASAIAATPMRTLIPSHPRLAVYGLLEARLVSADVMILGGLNENIWPEEAEIDPWLSRPMKRELGLMLPERRLGLTAHDFVQGFSGEEIYLSAAQKRDGTPAVISRWLLRLEALFKAAGKPEAFTPNPYWPGMALGLDVPQITAPCEIPMPRPALHLRPQRISVTQAEQLINDPYAYYARHILHLEPLKPLGPGDGAAEKGNLWHDILEKFTALSQGALGQSALPKLLQIAEQAYQQSAANMNIHAFWWPQFIRVAKWFIEQETLLRENITHQFCETKAQIDFPLAGKNFTLTAKADRLDILPGQSARILDYKTGTPPNRNDMENGKAPQLPLEAYLASQAGFAEIGSIKAIELAVMKLSGGYPAGDLKQFASDVEALAEANFKGLCGLLAAYQQIEQAYLPLAEDKKREDYDHLARYAEWLPRLSGEGQA